MAPLTLDTPPTAGVLSRRQAAQLLGLHPVTLARWAQTPGRGPRYSRTGDRKGRTMYQLDDLLEWLERRKQPQK